jgi:hypothetical protein
MSATYEITGNMRLLVNFDNTKTLDLSSAIETISQKQSLIFSYGAGANQINQIYSAKVTLADGANSTLNLYDSGTLLDAFGNALTISGLKLLYIFNNSADANLLLFGGNSADVAICAAATHQIIIPPGQAFIWSKPTAAGLVTTTNKNLRIAHDGTGTSTMAVDIIAGGIVPA